MAKKIGKKASATSAKKTTAPKPTKTAPKKAAVPKKKTAAPKKTTAAPKPKKKTAPRKRVADNNADPRTLLLSGVDLFNAWRHAQLDVAVDLTGADLRGANLRGAFLAGAAMDDCQLDDVALNGAIVSGASLKGASLLRADLRGVCFGVCELVEATLAMSPVGSALVRGANLSGASLDGARASESSFVECDLSGADLTDCDLRGANLARANLGGVTRGDAPPDLEATPEALWKRLRSEALVVREGIAVFGLLVHLAGGSNDESAGVLSSIIGELGLNQRDVDRISPTGQIVLDEMSLTPPSSQWGRRMVFSVMTGLAGVVAPISGMQLQVLGHFGEKLGFSNRAMARVLGEELGLSLSAS